ncbi:protein-tyrosine phosphatase [Diplodia corticola]|uniref:Protein-tyrosine phosphatase n=1 Tax=Diplodia corticola TaxID=236234 RepID=A0A1J9SCG1_9PEZI|nr:protein-tyrosine phosphatase [Diplodia corticola]OJD38135.1 protein-tyrosine phosphatase [Diplodia corticola]
MLSSSPLQVPGGSPNSSKRSLSHDSIRSSAAVSSLSIGSSPAGSARGRISADDGIEAPLPWFLRQSKTGRLTFKRAGFAEITEKFETLGWQERKRIAEGALQTNSPSRWSRVTGGLVAQRNRYMNVDPFAANRVQLKVPEGHDDYINASPIIVRSAKTGAVKKYIATQGPKDNTHHHMWRMIWHECASPAVIVMLTQPYEGGREKCYQYYPDSMESPPIIVNEHDEFGDEVVFEITLLSVHEDDRSRSTVRELEIKDRASGETKKVWHFLWPVWPDFGVPEGPYKHLLANLIPLSEEKNTDESSPRIVHCSAGVGRSGTFIALDHLLTELNAGALDDVPDGKDPVEETVEALRAQRMMMVQQDSQFALIYKTLREKWVDRWRERQGLPPIRRAVTDSGRGSSEEAAGAAAAVDTKRGGDTAEVDERDTKVARFTSSDLEERDARLARLVFELEAELRQNAAG